MIDQTKAPVLFTSSKHLDALGEIRDEITHVKTLVMLEGVVDAKRIFPKLEVVRFETPLADQADHIACQAKYPA